VFKTLREFGQVGPNRGWLEVRVNSTRVRGLVLRALTRTRSAVATIRAGSGFFFTCMDTEATNTASVTYSIIGAQVNSSSQHGNSPLWRTGRAETRNSHVPLANESSGRDAFWAQNLEKARRRIQVELNRNSLRPLRFCCCELVQIFREAICSRQRTTSRYWNFHDPGPRRLGCM
jgi:hypothetical protein